LIHVNIFIDIID